jgi:hypothetical protein
MKDVMKDVMEYLSSFGIHVNISESSEPIVLVCTSILILSIISLISFIQIFLSLAVLYISDHKYIMDKISKYSILVKIMSFYKQSRIGYILFEVCLFLLCMFSIIWLCIKILYILT